MHANAHGFSCNITRAIKRPCSRLKTKPNKTKQNKREKKIYIRVWYKRNVNVKYLSIVLDLLTHWLNWKTTGILDKRLTDSELMNRILSTLTFSRKLPFKKVLFWHMPCYYYCFLIYIIKMGSEDMSNISNATTGIIYHSQLKRDESTWNAVQETIHFTSDVEPYYSI